MRNGGTRTPLRVRRWYLALARVKDDGSRWAIIEANLRFAMFNLSISAVLIVATVVIRLT